MTKDISKCCNCGKAKCYCRQYYNISNLCNIFNQFLPLINRLCHKYYFNLYDLEDLKQEALITCYQSIINYNIETNVPFAAFFRLNLERKMCSLIRKESSQKRKANQQSVSYEFLEEKSIDLLQEENQNYNVETICFEKIELENVLKKLNPPEREILLLFLHTHKTPHDISQELHVPLNNVYRTLRNIKNELINRLSY